MHLNNHLKTSLLLLSTLIATPVMFAANNALVMDFGAFSAVQGKDQYIAISGFEGNHYTVTQSHDNNVLVGLGYYMNALEQKQLNIWYGIDAFYLPHTTVQGQVLQENEFANLGYHYSITNYPIYAAIKMLMKSNSGNYDVVFDLGMGPNFTHTSDYAENSLDGATVPDNIFSGTTTTAFSATAAVGIKFNHFVANLPASLSYRFFYLGQGKLAQNNSYVLNELKTGHSYANALVFSLYY